MALYKFRIIIISIIIINLSNSTELDLRRALLRTAEGRSAAAMYSCKYIEVSAAIDLHIDDLFVGIVRQIRSLRRRHDANAHHRRHHQRAQLHRGK